MNKKEIVDFLIKARTQTYAGGLGKVEPAFVGSTQMEYKDVDWFYRDVYNLGNGIFMGLETVYFKNKPVWSMSYFGDFSKMSEETTDKILRSALIKYKDKTRLWYKVEWEKDGFKYLCTPDEEVGIGHVSGMEEIYKKEERLYAFFYAGGVIG
jgi:hypothetical protein